MAKRSSKTTGNKRQREQDKIRKRREKEERKVARKQAALDGRSPDDPSADLDSDPAAPEALHTAGIGEPQD